MFDITDPLGIGSIVSAYKLDKWAKILTSCAVAAFISFWATLGVSGACVLAATGSPLMAAASGCFAASLVMAGAVFRTVQKSGALKELSIVLPAELEKIVEGTDVTQPPPPAAGPPPPANPADRGPELTG